MSPRAIEHPPLPRWNQHPISHKPRGSQLFGLLPPTAWKDESSPAKSESPEICRRSAGQHPSRSNPASGSPAESCPEGSFSPSVAPPLRSAPRPPLARCFAALIGFGDSYEPLDCRLRPKCEPMFPALHLEVFSPYERLRSLPLRPMFNIKGPLLESQYCELPTQSTVLTRFPCRFR